MDSHPYLQDTIVLFNTSPHNIHPLLVLYCIPYLPPPGYDRFAGPEGLRGLCMIRSVCEDLVPFIRNAIPPPMQVYIPPHPLRPTSTPTHSLTTSTHTLSCTHLHILSYTLHHILCRSFNPTRNEPSHTPSHTQHPPSPPSNVPHLTPYHHSVSCYRCGSQIRARFDPYVLFHLMVRYLQGYFYVDQVLHRRRSTQTRPCRRR